MIVTRSEDDAVLTTEDVLLSLCNSVTSVLSAATQTQVRFSGMVQRISKTCLKPDIGCFVLFDGGFSGLVVINFSAAAAMELYQSYMLSMGLSKEDLDPPGDLLHRQQQHLLSGAGHGQDGVYPDP